MRRASSRVIRCAADRRPALHKAISVGTPGRSSCSSAEKTHLHEIWSRAVRRYINLASYHGIVAASATLKLRGRDEDRQGQTTVAFIGVAFLTIAPTLAADLGVHPIYRAPPPASYYPPHFSWTGCYIGGHIGGGWGRETVSIPDVAFTTGRPPGTQQISRAGPPTPSHWRKYQ
jgi:hypothetical protein